MPNFAIFILVLAVVVGAAAYIGWSSRAGNGPLPPAAAPDDSDGKPDRRDRGWQ